jgi:hypothetical protein
MTSETYVDEATGVSGPEIVEHGGFVQVGHVGHVIAALELGWVHLLQDILLNGLLLQMKINPCLTSIIPL